MIAIAEPRHQMPTSGRWHEDFLALLPRIVRHAQLSSRALDPEARDEFMQAVVCASILAYAQLRNAGKSHLAYASALARYAVAHVRAGRNVGTPLNSNDVSSKYAQQARRFGVERLDQFDRVQNAWLEVAVEDKRSTPADIAALRIDFRGWLAKLSPRNRRIAETLALGETTEVTARKFGVSPGRISQIRIELKRSWDEFQKQSSADVSVVGAC